MYSNLKGFLFMKLKSYFINTQVHKITHCRRKYNNLLFIYYKISNCLKMNKTALLRHAQTQHSHESYDLDNILLCKANLFQICELEKTEQERAINTLETNDQYGTQASGETKNCVEFFAVEEASVLLLSSKEEAKLHKSNEQPKTLAGSPASTETKHCESFLKVEEAPVLLLCPKETEEPKLLNTEKRKADDSELLKDLKKAKLITKPIEIKRPGFTEERYNETSYYIENGLRKVYPYYFTFTTFTKGRWVGQKILDVFSREFRAHPSEEYERCIERGALTVNYEKVPIDYRLKHNDLLANTVHRHEVPVTGQKIKIVHMDEDIVVVNKPASIPVHPCGRYRHNTVVFILAKEYNLKNLRTIHRLDRLTSGLLLFGRSQKRARQLEHQIRNREVGKEYICRVEGEFPEGIVECNEPIQVVSFKIGVCKVSPQGKDCQTKFEKISYNGKTSVVLCKPLTGRMHQIRVHLQYLGFPVVNDPLYNHEVFGPLKGRGGDVGGRTDEELVRDLINIHNAENWLGIAEDGDISMFNTSREKLMPESIDLTMRENKECKNQNDLKTNSEKSSHIIDDAAESTDDLNNTNGLDVNEAVTLLDSNSQTKTTVATQTDHEFPDMTFNAAKMLTDKYCYDCKVRYRDPKPKDLIMYLHAWKYRGEGWEYETKLPNWASADWSEII